MVEGRGTSRPERASSDIQTQSRRAERNKPLRSRTVCGEAVRLTQGSPTFLTTEAAEGVIKPGCRGDPKASGEKRVADSQVRLMTRGLRSTGNSVEEKTLVTGKRSTQARTPKEASLRCGKVRTKGGCDTAGGPH